MAEYAEKQNTKISRCLVEALSVLKESSLEAVDSPELQSSFTEYMHIDREVQKEFWNIVQYVADSEEAQLILLCGSVGDGKSHILSYYTKNEPETMVKFKIHNDSTASYYKNKPAIETLKETLAGFSDEQIATSKEKWIIAINLGTLTNFLNGDTENRFTKLRDYVKQQNILDNTIPEERTDMSGNFHCVNFSDYHLYTLKDEKVKSTYIQSIFKKITDDTEDNIFNQAYKNNCMDCPNKNKCPVKANYEMLKNETVQTMLIESLIEAIIKGKIILSTRSIFDFIYELLVDRRYINDSSSMIRTTIENLNVDQYVNTLLPNTLFSHDDGKGIFAALSACDPLNIKNKEVDDLVIKVLNNANIISLIDEKIPELNGSLNKLRNIDFSEPSKQELNKTCLKLYIRASKLFNRNHELKLQDELYTSFLKDLYYWNKSYNVRLKDLYEVTQKAMLVWNGEAPKGAMRLNVGKHQMNYVISQEVRIKPCINNSNQKPETELTKFLEEINLVYQDKDGDRQSNTYQILIDYNLYKLIYSMRDGYKPNRKDKNLYVKFDDFVNQVEDSGSQHEMLIIEEKNRKNPRQYEFSYGDFGFTFEVKK